MKRFKNLLLLVGGSASAYYFREDLKTLPLVRNFFPEPELCIQVVTEARNPKTGEVKTFGTPCDVPKGWEEIPPEIFTPDINLNTNINTDVSVETQTEIATAFSDIFVNSLNSCTKYKTQFTHPLTGDNLTREIVGIVNGKCNYIEQMPNGGIMECKYTENNRKAVAQYYQDLSVAESAGTSFQMGESGSQRILRIVQQERFYATYD